MDTEHAPPLAPPPQHPPVATRPVAATHPAVAQADTPAGTDRGPADTSKAPPRPPHPATPPADSEVDRIAGLAGRLARSASGRGEALLADLRDILKARDGLQAAAVRLIQRAQAQDTAETCEQMGMQRWLRSVGGCTARQAGRLASTAETLAAMPNLQQLAEEGVVAAEVAAEVARLVKRRRRSDLARLDAAIAANVGRLSVLAPTAALGALVRLVERDREDLTEAKEQRSFESRFVSRQPALDGSGSIYGEFPAGQYTTVSAGLDAAAQPFYDTDDDTPAWKLRGRARADGLADMCARQLADGDDGPRATPSVQVVVDVHDAAQLADHRLWGQLMSPAGPVQATPRTVRRILSEDDPAIQTVFRDGYEILGITKPTKHIPDDLKAALAVRDGHARGPGSTTATDRCHRHHVTKRRDGGPTTLANLTLQDPDFHGRLDGTDSNGSPADHRSASHRTAARWELHIDPDGVCTYTNPATGTTHTTLPRAMRDIFPPGHPAYDGDAPDVGRDRRKAATAKDSRTRGPP